MSFSQKLSFFKKLRGSPPGDACAPADMALVAFCCIPAWRLHSSMRALGVSSDSAVKSARRRNSLSVFILIVLLALQPQMGACGPASEWAESVQMFCDISILAAATDALWV